MLAEAGNEIQSNRAVEILNNVLLPAMKDVGDKFGSGELILPFVLQSAEVMKKSVAYLENFLEKKAGVSKGVMVLATVYGDVHDIGKNLVKTILSNNGYEVIDLGKQVPAETIISKAIEVQGRCNWFERIISKHQQTNAINRERIASAKYKYPGSNWWGSHQPEIWRRILLTDSNEYYEAVYFIVKTLLRV